MKSKHKHFGLVGTGFLGKVLAQRLPEDIHLSLADIDEEKAEKSAAEYNRHHLSIGDLVQKADVILLTIPPGSIFDFIMQYEKDFKEQAVLVNLSTTVNIQDVKQKLSRNDLVLLSCKPVTQALAMSYGFDSYFVISKTEDEYVQMFTTLFGKLGKIVTGDAEKVGEINRYATKQGLLMYLQIHKQLAEMGVPNEIIETAVKTVAVGTILDYPITTDNKYIKKVLEEIKVENPALF